MSDGTVEKLLDRIEAAIDEGDRENAETLCARVLEMEPDNIDVRLYQAVMATETGDVEKLKEVETEVLERAPDNEEARCLLAEAYLGVGHPERTLELCDPLFERPQEDPARWLLVADALHDMGAFEDAVRAYEEVLALDPEEVDALVGLGVSHYERLEIDEALKSLETALELDENNADAHFFVGLILERGGDEVGARRAFERARALAPDLYPEPLDLPISAFETLVEEVLESLPERLRDYLANVPISVDEIPSDHDLRAENPPMTPSLWGLFRGRSLPEQIGDPWTNVPSEIVLYRRNLQRGVGTREELVEEIRITLQHEIAHFLGLDEEQVAQLGLA